MKKDEVIHLLAADFPEYLGKLKKLFIENEEFRELCTDYADCLESIAKLRRNSKNEMAKKFEEARVDLQIEILGMLKD